MEDIIANISIFAQAAAETAAPAVSAATDAAGAQPQGALGGGGMTILVYVLLFAGLWFLLFLPQRKQRKAMQKLQSELKVGDTVVTAGGIYGKIVSLDEAKATLEVAQGRITFVRGQIVGKAE
ncbi:MAG: preprotein translocase subunit YajC [Candidatus Spyradosoma sp.]